MGVVVAITGLTPQAKAQVIDLEATKSGDDVSLSWETGVGPFRVFRSTSPDFYFDNQVVAQGLVASAATVPTILDPSHQSQFILVLAAADPDPAGFYANPPPAPPPTITSLTPDSGPPGTVVIVAGSGFIADGSRMTVTFHHALAEISVATSSELQVVVPDDALSGEVLVCIASDACSNALPFHVTYGPAFQDISSIAFETGTGSLWVADRGTADAVYEIDALGTVVARGHIAQPLLGHPTPANGSGRIYYSNSTDAPGNLGTMEYIASATNAETLFDQAGVSNGESTPVRCEGIAATDLETDIAYFLDGVANTVRRIVRNALIHDLNYGNTSLFTFNRPAGARFDSAGNLYVSSTTAIYRILPNQTVELVGSGFTAASGMDLFEVGDGPPILAVADEATGEVYLVNTGTGARVRVYSGLSDPVGVAFADSPEPAGTALYVAEPTRILRLPDPRLEFFEKMDQKILLTKALKTDLFPSTSQKANGAIKVRVRLSGFIDPTGLTAHFRLVDPKDPSGYIVGATEDDNFPVSPAGSVTAQAQFDPSGVAEATLTVDAGVSGNNYRIEAGLAGGADFRPLAVSPVYTTWRRVYVEHDQMWGAGAWVRGTTTPGLPTATQVFVSSTAGFSEGDQVYVLSGDSPETANGELGQVATGGVGPDYLLIDVDPGAGALGLRYSYTGIASDDVSPFSFVAHVSDGHYGEGLNLAELPSAFDDAFAEWRVLPTGRYVPLFPEVPPRLGGAGDYMRLRSEAFFNADMDIDDPALNIVHLVSAASSVDLLGGTVTPIGTNFSWVFEGKIFVSVGAAIFEAARSRTTAHELTHQYNVNMSDPQGHDQEDTWLGGAHCLMYAPTLVPDLEQGIVKLHAPEGAPSNDLMCVRTHPEDINFNDMCSVP